MTTMKGDIDEQLIPWIDRALTGERVQFEIALPAVSNSGDEAEDRFYAITYQPLQVPGEGPRVIGVTVDVTARKIADEFCGSTNNDSARLKARKEWGLSTLN